MTLAQVTAALDAAGIARFKWPERLQMVEQMPMTPTQKIMRGRLAALLEEPGAGRQMIEMWELVGGR